MNALLIREVMKAAAFYVSMGILPKHTESDETILGPDSHWEKFAADGFLMSVEQMMRGMNYGIADMDLHVVNDGYGDDCGILAVETKVNGLGYALRIEVEPEKHFVGTKHGVVTFLSHKPVGRVIVIDKLHDMYEEAEVARYNGFTVGEVFHFYNRFVRSGEHWKDIAERLGRE